MANSIKIWQSQFTNSQGKVTYGWLARDDYGSAFHHDAANQPFSTSVELMKSFIKSISTSEDVESKMLSEAIRLGATINNQYLTPEQVIALLAEIGYQPAAIEKGFSADNINAAVQLNDIDHAFAKLQEAAGIPVSDGGVAALYCSNPADAHQHWQQASISEREAILREYKQSELARANSSLAD